MGNYSICNIFDELKNKNIQDDGFKILKDFLDQEYYSYNK